MPKKINRMNISPVSKLMEVRQRINEHAQFDCPEGKAQKLPSNLMPSEVYKKETLKRFDEAIDQIVKGK